jgi:hypothetical protein
MKDQDQAIIDQLTEDIMGEVRASLEDPELRTLLLESEEQRSKFRELVSNGIEDALHLMQPMPYGVEEGFDGTCAGYCGEHLLATFKDDPKKGPAIQQAAIWLDEMQTRWRREPHVRRVLAKRNIFKEWTP